MKLVTFKSAAGARAGILLAEGVVDLSRCDPKLPQSVRGILEAGSRIASPVPMMLATLLVKEVGVAGTGVFISCRCSR